MINNSDTRAVTKKSIDLLRLSFFLLLINPNEKTWAENILYNFCSSVAIAFKYLAYSSGFLNWLIPAKNVGFISSDCSSSGFSFIYLAALTLGIKTLTKK